jgi:hypothetical protein
MSASDMRGSQQTASKSPVCVQDFTTGTFFNRVIDDGKGSDNTRHLGRHPASGDAFLLPPDRVRRVLLVSGAVSLEC